MLGTFRRSGQLLVMRTSASATGSTGPPDTLTFAALQFMADITRANAHDRTKIDEKFTEYLKENSKSLDGLKAETSKSLDSLKAETSKSLDSLRAETSKSLDSLKADIVSLKDSMKADIHSLDKKVTLMIGIPSVLVTLVSFAAAANQLGLLDASTAPVVAKSMEAVASTPWWWPGFW